MKIGFIGVGRMGSRMAARLIEAGQVSVFDPNNTAVNELLAAVQLQLRAHKPQLSPQSVSCSASRARELFDAGGESGVLKSAKPGAIIVDFSTVDPATTKAIAAQCSSKDVKFIDSPVSGGVAGAASGNLVLMIGGDESVIAAARPELGNPASRIVHCGPVGAGQLTKLSHNLLTAINTVALGEVLSVSVKAGANLQVLCDVFGAGLAGSKMLDYLPKTLFTEERPANFAIDLMHKDISLCLQEFSNYSMPLGQLACKHVQRRSFEWSGWQGFDQRQRALRKAARCAPEPVGQLILRHLRNHEDV